MWLFCDDDDPRRSKGIPSMGVAPAYTNVSTQGLRTIVARVDRREMAQGGGEDGEEQEETGEDHIEA